MFFKSTEARQSRLAALDGLTLATTSSGGEGGTYSGVLDFQCTVSNNICKMGTFVYLETV